MNKIIRQFLLILLMLSSISVNAQETITTEEVYVTTQDFSSFRVLPSVNTERLAVIPPSTTLKAFGRTSRTDWIQVEYEGQKGWVASILLVWSGPVLDLPIDGVNPPDFIRRTVTFAETFRDTPIYIGGIDPSTQIGIIPAEEQFEVTGFVGTGELFWVQINYEGQLVWVGSWDVHVLDGRVRNTLNGGYRYVYGRANTLLSLDVSNSVSSLAAIERIWTRIGNGDSVECSPIPIYAIRATVDRDIEREPIFAPVVIALDDAIADINAIISQFEDLCTSNSPFVTIDDVNIALETLGNARRNLTLAQALINELSNRDPLVN